MTKRIAVGLLALLCVTLTACDFKLPTTSSTDSASSASTGIAKELEDAGYSLADESGEPTTTQVWKLDDHAQVTIDDHEQDGVLAIVSVDDQGLQGYADGNHFWCEFSGGPSLQVALTKFDTKKQELFDGAPVFDVPGQPGVREIPGTYCYVE